MAKSLKKAVWKEMSRYVRLRDSIDYCQRNNLPLDSGVARCCTCVKVVSHWKYADAGHFFGRGLGGGSGAYFDERNVNLQCKTCNGFQQGNTVAYREFMLQKYGQRVIDELEIKHRAGKKWTEQELIGLKLYYKSEFERLKQEAQNG